MRAGFYRVGRRDSRRAAPRLRHEGPRAYRRGQLERAQRIRGEGFPFVPGTLRAEIITVDGESADVPVRVSELSVVEEAFDAQLNPIRAKVSLSVRVLSVNDLPFGSKGGSLYLVHQQQKEALAADARYGVLRDLGIGELG